MNFKNAISSALKVVVARRDKNKFVEHDDMMGHVFTDKVALKVRDAAILGQNRLAASTSGRRISIWPWDPVSIRIPSIRTSRDFCCQNPESRCRNVGDSMGCEKDIVESSMVKFAT